MGVADLLNNLEPQQADGDVAIWLELPSGYLPLPSRTASSDSPRPKRCSSNSARPSARTCSTRR